MSSRSCCAQESPGGGGGGGNQRLRLSPHQVTPCIHDWEARNSSLTGWTVMKFFGTGTALKSCNLINPRWLERIKIQRGPVRQSVLHLASCDFPDSYEAVSFLCPWLRFDQESLIYDVLLRLIRGDDGPCVCVLCRSQSLLEYVDFRLVCLGLLTQDALQSVQ